jgi:hypothetical protein
MLPGAGFLSPEGDRSTLLLDPRWRGNDSNRARKPHHQAQSFDRRGMGTFTRKAPARPMALETLRNVPPWLRTAAIREEFVSYRSVAWPTMSAARLSEGSAPGARPG